jgi:hypothetical protein
MTVTVPSTDVVHYELYNGITTLTSQITAATAAGNGPLVFQLTKQKATKQLALVLSLIGTGKLQPSNILANETYANAQDGGEHRQ